MEFKNALSNMYALCILVGISFITSSPRQLEVPISTGGKMVNPDPR